MLDMMLIPGIKANSLFGNSLSNTVLSRRRFDENWTGNSSAPEVIEIDGVFMSGCKEFDVN
jgi:hypothetical protein